MALRMRNIICLACAQTLGPLGRRGQEELRAVSPDIYFDTDLKFIVKCNMLFCNCCLLPAVSLSRIFFTVIIP